MIEKEKENKKATYTIQENIYKYGYKIYDFLIDNLSILTIHINQLSGCCGVMHIANANINCNRNLINNEIKELIHQKILEIAKKQSLRSILYTDINNGTINLFLEDNYEVITKFRNPNSENIVEIRTFILSPEEFDENSDYDSDNYTPREDDDYYDEEDDDDY